MKRSRWFWVLGAVIALVVLVGLFFAMRSSPEATDPSRESGSEESQTRTEPEAPAAAPRAPRRINAETMIGYPEDYDLTPAEFHQRRLATLRIGQPEPGEGPVEVPGFKYITLNRPIDIDYSKVMPAGVELYEAALEQKILTGAPFTIILHDLDAQKCPDYFAGAYWEPVLPVADDVQSVAPPLVLKEMPTVQVVVEANQSIAFDGYKWCKSLPAKTDNRFAGDVMFRFKDTIPNTKEKIDVSPIRADFLLIVK